MCMVLQSLLYYPLTSPPPYFRGVSILPAMYFPFKSHSDTGVHRRWRGPFYSGGRTCGRRHGKQTRGIRTEGAILHPVMY